MTASETRPVVVVGVDGSRASKDVLRWAARQAQLTGAELRAVIAWRWPTTYGWAPDYSGFDFAADARKTLEEAVTEALGAAPSVPVIINVIEATRPRCSSTHPGQPTCLSSAAVDTARSPECCSAPSVSTASNTRPAQCSSTVTPRVDSQSTAGVWSALRQRL